MIGSGLSLNCYGGISKISGNTLRKTLIAVVDVDWNSMEVAFYNPDGTIMKLDLPPIIGTCPLEEVSPDYLNGWRKLLVEPHLVDQSIAIETLSGVFLAVPIGEIRRSGCFDFGCEDPQAVVDILKDQSGFPNLRIYKPNVRDEWLTIVAWGEEPPNTNNRDNGKWYGYCSEEIEKFYSDEHYESPLKHHSRSRNRI